ncbi:MAG: hypothetical protein KME20_24045 [Kaiparowitsia implicata GSE-PSE-MK54-09C]|jgi:hypothetical protein|nr:hypothetical protein [Kaiparowitsia implicata GSE-PSE-MK54-09C]
MTLLYLSGDLFNSFTGVNAASLFEFSRAHCIGICAFLVPANLLATLQTLIWVGLHRSASQIRLMVGVSGLYALVMLGHVATWFMIGVVAGPTFVLTGLALTCLSLNSWAIAHPSSLVALLQRISQPFGAIAHSLAHRLEHSLWKPSTR